jgi:hypothetical protein
VDTLLFESTFYNSRQPTFRASLRVSGNKVDVYFSFQQGAVVTDNSLTHGRGGVVTWLARADFDDLHVSATDEYELFYREWGFGGNDYESGMHELSGHWAVLQGGDEEESYLAGLYQSDTSGDARAIIGTPVANQELTSWLKVNSFAASQTGAWVGMVARYVDAKNYYYVTMRASGQIQIKKIVNGVITVLASSNFTAVLGQVYRVRFLVINDQLQLYVDEALVASAHDADIASGQYGIATYRAAATWDLFGVVQP